jgi:hypothetical protein
MKTYLITELLPSCPRASSCTAETDFVHYICMAFYVRYSLHVMQFRCLYPICILNSKKSKKIKKSQKAKKGLLCSLRGLCNLHGLLGCLIVLKNKAKKNHMGNKNRT